MNAARPVSYARREHASPAGVLVIEPEEPVRSLICRILESEGYRVMEAACARDALDLPAQEARSVDVIVTDIAEPGISGVRGLRRRIAPQAVVLRLSVIGPDWWEEVDGEPGTFVLAKPFAGDALADTVRDLLEKKMR